MNLTTSTSNPSMLRRAPTDLTNAKSASNGSGDTRFTSGYSTRAGAHSVSFNTWRANLFFGIALCSQYNSANVRLGLGWRLVIVLFVY
ncbi:hypothetical protein Ga0100231_015950 [Opitutaceae bacterium TAV4]|nr:hypothetical protein Ga0100231_015950 [Opitutaceae bacterium TAV4]RRJ99860.1 hypothetical protein Ga0100230_017685 [Opitutaceae bacterium TAV3]